MVTLADVNARFAGLASVPEEERAIRGVVLAVAHDWYIRLEDGPAKEEALRYLEMAANRACKALPAA